MIHPANGAHRTMPWTPNQLEEVYRRVYAYTRDCPACNSKLQVTPVQGALLGAGHVECPTCQEHHLLSLENDPLRETFRPYTPAERTTIEKEDRARRTPHCPIDGAPMLTNAQRSLGINSNVEVWCKRCGERVTFRRISG